VAIIEESSQMDEENTERKVIELFGGGILSTGLELEYPVQMRMRIMKCTPRCL
jgi:hypothetical protein